MTYIPLYIACKEPAHEMPRRLFAHQKFKPWKKKNTLNVMVYTLIVELTICDSQVTTAPLCEDSIWKLGMLLIILSAIVFIHIWVYLQGQTIAFLAVFFKWVRSCKTLALKNLWGFQESPYISLDVSTACASDRSTLHALGHLDTPCMLLDFWVLGGRFPLVCLITCIGFKGLKSSSVAHCAWFPKWYSYLDMTIANHITSLHHTSYMEWADVTFILSIFIALTSLKWLRHPWAVG